MCARCLYTPELSIGPFCVTRCNPTHQLIDPTQPNPWVNPAHGQLWAGLTYGLGWVGSGWVSQLMG